MDAILLGESGSCVLEGLRRMVEAAIGPHEFIYAYEEIQNVLLIIEIAKLAPDRPDWFPRGKWATIQSMQSKAEAELAKLKFSGVI